MRRANELEEILTESFIVVETNSNKITSGHIRKNWVVDLFRLSKNRRSSFRIKLHDFISYFCIWYSAYMFTVIRSKYGTHKYMLNFFLEEIKPIFTADESIWTSILSLNNGRYDVPTSILHNEWQIGLFGYIFKIVKTTDNYWLILNTLRLES